MTIRDTYDKRRRLREQAGTPLVYRGLPATFRRQVVGIWDRVLGHSATIAALSIDAGWSPIVAVLRNEWGYERLPGPPRQSRAIPLRPDPRQELIECFLMERYAHTQEQTDRHLAIIEAVFAHALEHEHEIQPSRVDLDRLLGRGGLGALKPRDAVDELNRRFHEHHLGYRFDPNLRMVVMVDSEALHKDVIEPALKLVHEPGWETAEEEYRRAHHHHRDGAHEEAVVCSTKALESILKIIAARHAWPSNDAHQKDVQRLALGQLVRLATEHHLIPPTLHNQFGQIQGLLGSAGALRNQQAAHGQGTNPRQVPAHLSRFALAQTASCIVLLVELDREFTAPSSST